jgi:hypothetical protein
VSREKIIKKLKESVKTKIKKRLRERRNNIENVRPYRVDDVFVLGQDWLNSIDGENINWRIFMKNRYKFQFINDEVKFVYIWKKGDWRKCSGFSVKELFERVIKKECAIVEYSDGIDKYLYVSVIGEEK